MKVKIASNTRYALMLTGAVLFTLPVQVLAVHAEPISCDRDFNISSGGGDHDEFSEPEAAGNVLTGPELCQNLAIANALADPDLVAGENFGIRLNFGTAANESATAIGIGVAGVLSDNLNGTGARLTGSGAVAISGDQRGTRLGLQLEPFRPRWNRLNAGNLVFG
ncbi:MAG: hypothetical protein KDJ80_11250 [Nitratireductor sp.]|nr:hypothetical protein [Nitratireductor sp.]